MTTIAPALSMKFLPRMSEQARDLLLIVAGSLLLALLAQVRIPLPFTPVPVTGQTFGVLLIGAALGARRGVATIVLYIGEGVLGLPFFAGGNAGPAALAGPTAGYLLGFVAAAYVVGLLAERGWERSLRTSLLPFLAGTAVIYVFGAAWLSFVMNSVGKALALGVLPFLIGDAIKLVAAALILPAAWRLVRT